jgi:2-hydroxychromene-2-carboxylate isomerase
VSVAELEKSRLSVLLDIRQPQACLALHPAAGLAEECGIGVNWLPLVVPPLLAPSEPRSDDDRGVNHRRHRAQAMAREIATYAAVQGLVIREYYRDGDPAELNLAWLWVREQYPERLFSFLAEAFRAYWAVQFEISSVEAVASLVDRCGAGEREFQSWRVDVGPRKAAALAEELQAIGVTRAPCYLVQDEVFVGRQHLAMIRWILTGRRGPGPI